MAKSLKDIADELHLSKTTISWVLSGQAEKKGLSKRTTERVLKCAHKYNYQPNFLARSLNTQRTGMLGLIIPDLSDTFYASLARLTEMEAEKNGYTLMIGSSEGNYARENNLLDTFRNKLVDGIIIASTQKCTILFDSLASDGYPVVTIDRLIPQLPFSSIVLDNRQASYRVVKDMIGKGAKRIALFTTNSYLHEMQERRIGYEKALQEAGIESQYVLDVPFEEYASNLIPMLENLLSQQPAVDGLFFATHTLANEVYRYFFQHKISFDAYHFGCIHEEAYYRSVTPSIHVARMPIEKMAEEAVRIVSECIECRIAKKEQPQEHLVLEATHNF